MQSRRQFLARSGAASAAVFAPQALMSGLASAKQAPLLKSGRFAEGVASGDPGARAAITLWTRVAELERKGSVRLEVARDKSFRHVVARDLVGTSPGKGGSVKARVTGLKPYEQYFYRFETKDGSSQVGRFRTAPPADSRQELTFAFFSCQDFTHGFYNAHELMAREDIDFSVCLGDYIYAESYHTVAGGTGVRDDDDRRHDVQRPPARRHDARRLPRQVRAVPLRRVAAQGPGARADGRDLGRPRGAEQLRGRRPGRRPAGRRALQRAAPGGRLQGVVRVDAHVRQARTTGSSGGSSSARRWT